MSLENLVGWDFVKLETELKVRVLPQLLDGAEAGFLRTVLKFECFLAASSLAMHNQAELPQPTFQPEGLNRLARIILAIRRQAQRHLGVQRLRDRQWLEEYYFLLACYGVYAGLFETYQSNRRQIAAVYISAGVAARQLGRPTQRLNGRIREKEAEADRLQNEAGFDPAAYESVRPRCEMSYHARLAFAKRWVRSKKPPFRDAAIAILDQLRDDYPHVLEIEDELALAYLEADRPSEFEGVLSVVMSRYGQLSEEFLCRIGRFWKDRGDKVRATDRSDALSCFEKALDWYRKGYAIRAYYYPGINVAGLQFILGKTEPARQVAEAVLRSLEGPAPPEELGWVRATQADARLLLENHPEAEALYRQSARLSDPQGRASMRRQVELLAAYAPPASTLKSYWTEDKLDEIFRP
jgi:hypothetical protein